MSAPARRAAGRTRLCTSVADLHDLITLARRINALAAEHGIAQADARRLAEDERDARAGARQPAGGAVPPPRLTTEKRRYQEPDETTAAYPSRRSPTTADEPTATPSRRSPR
ncbi:hypothetical protein [Microbispora rosea]|uniref:hypothetical protein n=1 Tax=Microbispora rosea TaxID=58117 RepID=UPI00379549FD